MVLMQERNSMIKQIDWDDKVVEDYRQRIIVDADNSILAFKASRAN